MIRVARGLELPLSVVTEKTSILAKTGAGKSNTAKVIVEGVLGAGAQVVILDPVGHWYGLRSMFPIPVIGGMMGDVPLDPHAGKLMARIAAESGHSMVLDVSLFDSDGEMQRFAYEFAEEFYKLKQRHPSAVLLVLEEADEFAPQDTRGANVARMVGAFARIAKRGRGRGIGLLNVTLRSAALSKNVLNQSDTIVAMRTTAPLDIEAVREWVKYQRVAGAEEVIPSLPGLETGEAWFWTPERAVLSKVRVSKAKSLDTSATPEVGVQVERPKALKAIDLESLGEEMRAFAEKAKADDPDELRRRLAAAERELAALRAQGEREVVKEVPVEVVREVPVLSDHDRALIGQVSEHLRGVAEPAANLLARLDEIVHLTDGQVTLVPRGGSTALVEAAPFRQEPVVLPEARVDLPPRPKREGRGVDMRAVHANGDGPPLRAGARRIVEALASHHPMRLTRSQVATLAKLKKTGGTFGTYWSQVKTAGLIDEDADGAVLTQAGIDYVGGVPEPASPEELLEMWRGRLRAGARAMLDELVRIGGRWTTRAELGAVVDLEPSGGTFGTYLSVLRSAGLVDVDGQNVRASETLFLGVRA